MRPAGRSGFPDSLWVLGSSGHEMGSGVLGAERLPAVARRLIAGARELAAGRGIEAWGIDSRPSHGARAIGSLGELHGVVRLLLHDSGQRVVTVSQSATRKLLLGALPKSDAKTIVAATVPSFAGCAGWSVTRWTHSWWRTGWQVSLVELRWRRSHKLRAAVVVGYEERDQYCRTSVRSVVAERVGNGLSNSLPGRRAVASSVCRPAKQKLYNGWLYALQSSLARGPRCPNFQMIRSSKHGRRLR